MPIYKRCSKCGKRIPSGTTCECIKQIRRQQKKERDKDYDQHRRNKTRATFYKTKAWRLTKEDVLTHYMYIDLYAYYHDGKFIPATMVHHIVPISTDYAKRLDRGNLIALSDKSHGIVHKAMKEGREEEMVGHNALAAGFQGQRQWTDFYPNCDFPEAMLNSSFDWNGAREPYILATENDVLNGLGMLFSKLLTNSAQIFADVRTYWSPEAVKRATDGYELEGHAKEAGGFIHLINSGAACLDANGQSKDADGNGCMKPWYDVTEEDQEAMLNATTWNYADFGYFRGGGFSSRFVTEAEMPVTMTRLNLVKNLGPMLQIAEGWTVKLPDEVTDVLWKRTDYTWPCTWFAPRVTGEGAFTSAYDVMNNWGANHGAISYGHIGADLITLCSILRIPVAMHNVPEEKIFRPASWNAFGQDKEGQDFRACQAYGPMYKSIR